MRASKVAKTLTLARETAHVVGVLLDQILDGAVHVAASGVEFRLEDDVLWVFFRHSRRKLSFHSIQSDLVLKAIHSRVFAFVLQGRDLPWTSVRSWLSAPDGIDSPILRSTSKETVHFGGGLLFREENWIFHHPALYNLLPKEPPNPTLFSPKRGTGGLTNFEVFYEDGRLSGDGGCAWEEPGREHSGNGLCRVVFQLESARIPSMVTSLGADTEELMSQVWVPVWRNLNDV